MPTTNIKWKITAKKPLKPDTFHGFVTYIFKIFPEAQAKLLREQTVERIFSENTSIHRFVISEAILRCLHLILHNHAEDSILFMYV